MTPQQIAADIERGRQLVEQINALKAELKAIEARLKAAGEAGPHIPLEDAEREGKQCLVSSDSNVLPIRFTSDSIVASFNPDGPMHAEILSIVGKEKFPLFFRKTPKFFRVPKDGHTFRKVARANLEPDAFAHLIQAATERNKKGIAKSTVVIAWDDLRPLETSHA